MAKTGQIRKTRQPLKIDRLPPAVHDAIRHLRNIEGLTWVDISRRSAEPVGAGKLGFVEWENLPTPVLELFPDLRIDDNALHRWWDLRVDQVQADVMRMSEQARVIAKVFAKAAVPGDRVAVQTATRDILLGILAEDGTARSRMKVAAGLIALAEVQQATRANDVRERKVSVDERKIAQLEKDAEQRRRRMDAEADKLAKKASKGEVTEDDINRLRERVFGMPPKPKAAA